MPNESRRRNLAQGVHFRKNSESQDFEPDFNECKKLNLPINRNKIGSGSWSLDENKIYLNFILANREAFETEKARRRQKTFYRLSKVLKRRTADQCRSHHQKLQIKYRDQLSNIIKAVKMRIAVLETEQKFNHKEECLREKEKEARTCTTRHFRQENKVVGQGYELSVGKNINLVLDLKKLFQD